MMVHRLKLFIIFNIIWLRSHKYFARWLLNLVHKICSACFICASKSQGAKILPACTLFMMIFVKIGRTYLRTWWIMCAEINIVSLCSSCSQRLAQCTPFIYRLLASETGFLIILTEHVGSLLHLQCSMFLLHQPSNFFQRNLLILLLKQVINI
jgi:hypothetical protein